MTAYDSIVVEGEFVSEHFLAEEFAARVRSLRREWSEREQAHPDLTVTARQGLTRLAARLVVELTKGRERDTDDYLPALHDGVAEALLLDREPEEFVSFRAGVEQTVPARVFRDSGRVPLLVLEARDARAVEELFDHEDGTGVLLSPLVCGAETQHATVKVLSNLFLADHEPDRPDFVLVLAGGWVLLAGALARG
ncbi:MAG: hypothetical protein ACRDSQ_31435, partial [Actinokineospora sp.]